MYYPLPKCRLRLALRKYTALYVLSISILSFSQKSNASVLEQTAEQYRAKGYEQQQNGNYGKALDYYLKAVSLGVESAPLYNDIGVIFEQMKMPDKAQANYLKALDLDGNYLPPYTNLAYLHLDHGNVQQAIVLFEERLKRAPAGDPWISKIDSLLIDIDPKRRKEIFDKQVRGLQSEVVQKNRDEFYLEVIRGEKHYHQGQEYLNNKNYDRAIAEFERALSVTPQNPKLLKAIEEAKYFQRVDGLKKEALEAVKDLEAGEMQAAKEKIKNLLANIPDESNRSSD